jgi:hypothetical protein
LQIFVVYASEAECNIYFHILVPLKLYWVKCSCTEFEDNKVYVLISHYIAMYSS